MRSVIEFCSKVVVLAAALSFLAGCSTNQIHSSTVENAISLESGDIDAGGLAFITPSTATGQEQDKQALALIFGETLIKERPKYRVVTLAKTLGAINRAGLADEYKQMFQDYRVTGIFDRDILRKIGLAVGARYLAQLKLAGFSQGSKERFSVLGIRMMQTLHANIRVFLQIWDSQNGTVAWEGAEELNYAYDTDEERPVTFRDVVVATAHRLIKRLPP